MPLPAPRVTQAFPSAAICECAWSASSMKLFDQMVRSENVSASAEVAGRVE